MAAVPLRHTAYDPAHTLFILVALVIGGFQAFISIYLITGGGRCTVPKWC